MQRRRCIGALAAGVVVDWRIALAQPAERVYRVGILRPGAPPRSASELQEARISMALRELGYVQGRNLSLVTKYAGGDNGRLPALARELLQAQTEIVVAVGAQAVQAMTRATSSVPIVMYGNFDPLVLGLVGSLARPGGNVTGVLIAPDGTLAGKRLELLKAAVPDASRIALLVPDDDGFGPQMQETRKAAQALGIELPVVVVRGGDYAGALAAVARQRAAALVVGSHQYFMRDRQQIIELVATHRLPAMYEWREQVADGGLMTYSTSLDAIVRRVAAYVDRILKGAKPGDLPIERPTTFELVINLKTAKALGLTIPQALLLRADEVIE